jgi:anti-sigma regulatory factor (Ser/Thr protein kinase)
VSVETRGFVNDVAELRRLSEWIRAYATAAGLEEGLTYHVDLCLDEAVSNIIRFGYEHASRGIITVSLEVLNDRLRAIVVDAGRMFNPVGHAPPVVPTVLDDVPVGGFGIPLMRSFADALEYRRDGERNILTLHFRR